MKIENISNLKINKLTKVQYERELAYGNIKDNELYLIPDEDNGVNVKDWNQNDENHSEYIKNRPVYIKPEVVENIHNGNTDSYPPAYVEGMQCGYRFAVSSTVEQNVIYKLNLGNVLTLYGTYGFCSVHAPSWMDFYGIDFGNGISLHPEYGMIIVPWNIYTDVLSSQDTIDITLEKIVEESKTVIDKKYLDIFQGDFSVEDENDLRYIKNKELLATKEYVDTLLATIQSLEERINALELATVSVTEAYLDI